MKFSRSKPGFAISAAVHIGLLVAALVLFSDTTKFEDAREAIPVEMITDQQLDRIAKGEKTGREAKPATRVDKVAVKVEPKPHPPVAEAKKDVPTPPPALKRLAEPSDADTPPTPPKRAAAAPPPKEAPAPPAKPLAKAAPEPDKDEPADAEVVRPKPPTRPKLEATAKETPKPPKAKEEPRLKVDEVAKLLAQKKQQDAPAREDAEKAEKPAQPSKPRSGDEAAQKSRFNAANIANLLSREAPQQRAATGRDATRLASLGAPTAIGAKPSASMQGKIDSYTVEHYRRCWVSALSMNALSYTPRIEFRLTHAGALEGPPRLLNPSAIPVEKSRGEQALAAVRRCSPMPIPADFEPYYDYWRVTELDMKEDM
jgi:colicin import membrane protein